MRIGIFGGSFDPVHTGHLIVAECCREQASLDRVLFVPAAIQPHKQDRSLATGAHRLAMLALATGGHPSFAVSSDEVDRGGVSYSIETVQSLSSHHSGDELLLILGPDALAGLPMKPVAYPTQTLSAGGLLRLDVVYNSQFVPVSK